MSSSSVHYLISFAGNTSTYISHVWNCTWDEFGTLALVTSSFAAIPGTFSVTCAVVNAVHSLVN